MSTAGTILFVLCAVVALFAAGFTVTAKSAIRAAVGLLAHIISLAALYLTLHAHLLATLQLIVYAGAVVVLFIFVIMLIGPVSDGTSSGKGVLSRVVGAALMGIVTVAIAFNVGRVTMATPAIQSCPGGVSDERWTTGPDGAAVLECGQFGGVREFGLELFREASVPFELVSVLLLVAIIGAIAVGRGRTPLEVAAMKARKEARLKPPAADVPVATDTAEQPAGGE